LEASNYLFGLGVAICGEALWLALEREPTWLRIAASGIIALVCFLSHIAAFGFYALLVCGLELRPVSRNYETKNGPR